MRKPRIAIIGKGALGMLYGSMVQDALGADAVTFVMDPARLAKHAGDVSTVNGCEYPFRDAVPEEAGVQDLVILAVKSYGLESALDLVPSLLGEKTRIISVLNGIRSEERIAARFGWERIVPCVAQGMDAAHFGTSLTYSKTGELHIGCFEKTPQEALREVEDILTRAGIAHVVEEDICYRMWAKFMLNVGINQTCCAFGASYGDVYADETSELWRHVHLCHARGRGIGAGRRGGTYGSRPFCVCSARADARSRLDALHGAGSHQPPQNRSGRVLGRGHEKGREAPYPRAGECVPEQAHTRDRGVLPQGIAWELFAQMELTQ